MTEPTQAVVTPEGLAADEVPERPWPLLREWVDHAATAAGARPDVPEPRAMAVATLDDAHRPDVRTVLLQVVEPAGLGFLGSGRSTKAAQLATSPAVAATLTWSALFRAVRVRGVVQALPGDVLERLWRERPWDARVAAWLGPQSAPVAGREVLEAELAAQVRRRPEAAGADGVPVPPDWAGWRIVCAEVEFWAGRRDRLHDRFRYTRDGEGGLDDPGWGLERLRP